MSYISNNGQLQRTGLWVGQVFPKDWRMNMEAAPKKLIGKCFNCLKDKTLSRARDPRAKGTWLNKLTE